MKGSHKDTYHAGLRVVNKDSRTATFRRLELVLATQSKDLSTARH